MSPRTNQGVGEIPDLPMVDLSAELGNWETLGTSEIRVGYVEDPNQYKSLQTFPAAILLRGLINPIRFLSIRFKIAYRVRLELKP